MGLPEQHIAGFRHGRVPRAVREQQLLDVAEQLLVDNGYAGFSVEELCRHAGVTRPVVYHHFGSKDGVYLACLRRIRDGFADLVDSAAAAGPDLDSAIRQGADAFFSVVEHDPRRWSLIYGNSGALVGGLGDQLFELRFPTIDRLAVIVQRFAPHAEWQAVTAASHAISGAAVQIGRWWLRNPTVARRQIVDYYLVFAFGALNQLADNAMGPSPDAVDDGP